MRIVHDLPNTNFLRPTTAEARELLRIVRTLHPEFDDVRGSEFDRALYAIGFQFRLNAPTSKHYFAGHCDRMNAFLSAMGMDPVEDGNAVMAAVLAHGEVQHRKSDPALGQVTELALDPHVGERCSNRWRLILAGEPLLAPLPARGLVREVPGRVAGNVRVFQEDHTGRMRELGKREPIRWSR